MSEHTKMFVLTLLVVSAGAVAVYVALDTDSKPPVQNDTDDAVATSQELSVELQEHGDGEYYFPPGGFTFTPPAGWDRAEMTDLNLPSYISEPEFAFRTSGSAESCVIAYARFAQNAVPDHYEQTRYSYQIENVEDLWNISRRAPKDRVPDDYEPQLVDHWTEYIAGEIAYAVYPYRSREAPTYPVFVLYSSDDTPVSRECDRDFVTMMESLERTFPETNLDEDSRGVIYLQSSGVDAGPYDHQVMFVADDTKIPQSVMGIEMQNIAPTVWNDMLYYISDEYQLVGADIFESEAEVVVDTPGAVNAFYPRDDRLFYLEGPWCREYMAECDVALMERDLQTGAEQELASGLSARDIVGLLPEDNRLYLRDSFGDAGCWRMDVTAYDFDTKAVESVRDVSVCTDDEDYDEATRWREEFNAQFDSEKQTVERVRIENGELQLPTDQTYVPQESLRSVRFLQ